MLITLEGALKQNVVQALSNLRLISVWSVASVHIRS